MTDSSQQQNETQFVFSGKRLMGYMGPGLLISMAFLDPGNMAGNIYCGQAGEYRLLWVLLWATVLGYYFQHFALKLGVIGGVDMGSLCRKFYPKNQRILLWIMAEIAIIGADIQEVLGTAIALNIIFGIEMWLAVLITI